MNKSLKNSNKDAILNQVAIDLAIADGLKSAQSTTGEGTGTDDRNPPAKIDKP